MGFPTVPLCLSICLTVAVGLNEIDYSVETKVKQQLITNLHQARAWKLRRLSQLNELKTRQNAGIELSVSLHGNVAELMSQIDFQNDGTHVEFEELDSLVTDLEEKLPVISSTVSTFLPTTHETTIPYRPYWWYATFEPPIEIEDSIGVGFDGYYDGPSEFYFDKDQYLTFSNVTFDIEGYYNVSDGTYTAGGEGVHLIFLQLDVIDDMISVLDLVAIDPYTEEVRKLGDVVPGVSPAFTFASTYLIRNEKIAVIPNNVMDGFPNNIRPGPQSRLSIYNMRDTVFSGTMG